MANRKLTELPTLSPINFDSTDLLYIVDVQTDASKKITYASLVGNSITGLISYNDSNTLNINFLSGSIDQDRARLNAIEATAGADGTRIDSISAAVSKNITDILTVSALAIAGDNTLALNALRTDVNVISTVQLGLSAELDELSDDTEGLQSVLATASALGLTNETGLAAVSLSASSFNMVAAASSDLSASHTFNVNLGGTTYKILLRQA
tara:strand:- start:1349 stop:1978 length:630 start_codon:yes stop_codon:yes gene_type:complete